LVVVGGVASQIHQDFLKPPQRNPPPPSRHPNPPEAVYSFGLSSGCVDWSLDENGDRRARLTNCHPLCTAVLVEPLLIRST